VQNEIAAAAAENFVAHASWASRRIPGAFVDAGEELTLIDSGLDSDTFNIVCRARLSPASFGPAANRVIEHFVSVSRPFSWWVSPGDGPADLGARLESCGLLPSETELAMSARIDAIRAPCIPGLEIERVRTPQALADFALINAENWTPPDPAVTSYYRRAAAILLGEDSPQRFYLSRLEGAPAAAVEVTLAAGVAGVYNLSTRPLYRRRGVGAATLEAALADAGALGLTAAVLQAAGAGQSLYRRLGFEEFGVITEHKLEGL
jgi:ribosomal protein S18 acetylase RimI-like enzyme